jgi:hypothetical protein
MNRVGEVVDRRAVRPSGQRMRRWERNWDPSLVARNLKDPVWFSCLGKDNVYRALAVPDDLLLAWRGLAVSVLDRFYNDNMCAHGLVTGPYTRTSRPSRRRY